MESPDITTWDSVLAIVLAVVAVLVYFLPTILAIRWQRRQVWLIAFLNVFGFVFGVPWVIALVITLWREAPPTVVVVDRERESS